MSVIIRRISESDYESVMVIWNEVLDVPVTFETLCETYSAMAEDDRYCTFIAEVDGVVAGLITAVHTIAIGHPGGYLKMNGLGVLPEYQNWGIGRMLLEEVERFAIEKGAPYISLASGIRRTDAHGFYEHLGYRKTSYWFRKDLTKRNSRSTR